MTFSRPHVPPRGSETFATDRGGPPARSTRHNRPRAKKQIDRLSGDQNGATAPSEPATGCKSNAFSDRTKRREPDPSMTRKATARPSGETAGVWSIAAPGGAAIDNANVDISAVGRRAHSDAVTAAAAIITIDERTPRQNGWAQPAAGRCLD